MGGMPEAYKIASLEFKIHKIVRGSARLQLTRKMSFELQRLSLETRWYHIYLMKYSLSQTDYEFLWENAAA